MKVSSVAVIGGLAALASANQDAPAYYEGAPEAAQWTTTVEPTTYLDAAAAPTTTSCATPSKPAVTHKVQVGAFGQNVYSPDRVEANIGDVVSFEFLALNHTLSQSDFNTPCTFNGGFDTGFEQFNPDNKTGLFIRELKVEDTNPKWFYCRQGNHCTQGMVFGINPAGKMDEFIQKAKASGNSTATPPISASGTTDAAYGNVVASPTGHPAGDAAGEAPSPVATVLVGLDQGKTLKFEPPYLANIKKGDTIHFDFRAVNHTLTESSFEEPCNKLADGAIDTNFANANADDTPNLVPFDLTLDTDADMPRWFYCKQAKATPNSHCGKGMVFAINPKSADQFKEFLTTAESTLPKIKGRGLTLGQME
ncbi:MAG: hypothetical protein M1815_000882 [Lichina confinis]|nr:MAG: hypothetical protein M1815_000882 [Lichina confinis]